MEFDLLELLSKPAAYKYTDEEFNFLKSKIPKSRFSAKCCLYKKKSKKGYYIAFMIDLMPNHIRRSGVENVWEVISTRKLSDIEYEEQIHNYGCNIRRYVAWYYFNIEYLIMEDLKYGVATPAEFIRECKKRGYSKSIQLEFDFE